MLTPALWTVPYAGQVLLPEQCVFGATPLSDGEGQPRSAHAAFPFPEALPV